MKNIKSFLIVSALFLSLGATQIFAVSTPDFPNCANASGTVLASYPDGVHGIVGNTQAYVGSDTVYQLSVGTVMQCFCGPDGQGIQTNWWNAASLSEDNIQILKAQGWYYVPDGSVWGLEADPYMAQNISYNCQPGKAGSNDNPNRSGGSGGGTGGGDILGAAASTGDVLGLAATGNSAVVFGTFALAILFLLVGLSRIRKSRFV